MTDVKVLDDNELESLIDYVDEHLHLSNYLPEEYSYNNPVLIILDAVLSKNRNYDKAKVWIKNFKTEYENIKSLNDLEKMIEFEGAIKVTEKIKYKDVSRIIEIKDVAETFLDLKLKYNEQDDLKAMKKWAEETDFTKKDDPIFKIKGIGIATFQYLRILSGAQTCKPDVHIKNFLNDVLGRKIGKKISEESAVRAVAQLAQSIDKDTRIVDNAIWKYQRSKNDIKKVTVEDMKYYIDFLDERKLIEVQKYIEKKLRV
ncbi:hypothetical protein [Enterococcus avium]|uniref:hypothetical protein n=1 Tax=Enterococcus avium TaxID=33945 RepID=UPI000FD63B5F|nr:hypothetical protein [Enterococcus avium]MDT2565842.1 hypothetical protein [Enterococcus avium]